MISKISIEELHKLGLISVRAMNVCRRGGIKTLEQLIKIDGNKLQDIKSCGKGTLMELNLLRAKVKLPNTEVSQKTDSPKQNPKLKEAQCKLESLSPFSRAKLLAWIEWRFAKLSIRAKRAFSELSVCETAIDTIYSSESIVVPSAKNCGRKTIWEIELYLTDIKTHFEKITAELQVTDEPQENKRRNLEIVQLSRSYSFLLNKECEAIIDFKCKGGVLPYLYIAKLFIARSHMPQIGMYRDYYGFNRSLKRLSLSEISEKYKLSRERVRQLLSKSISLPSKLKEEIKKYLEPLVGNVVAFDNSLWGKIQEENMLDESHAATALLVCALMDTHTAIQIVDCDKEYLVNESIIENVRLKQVLKDIVRIIKMRRTTIEQLDILQCITFEDKSYHKDVEELCVIYADYLKRNFGVEIDRNRIITLTPNAFDISGTIENYCCPIKNF